MTSKIREMTVFVRVFVSITSVRSLFITISFTLFFTTDFYIYYNHNNIKNDKERH